jgi:hypothetical protein
MDSKKILIIYDCDGWCHHMIAGSIKHYYSDTSIIIDVISQKDLISLKSLQLSRYSLFVHIGWATYKRMRTPRERSLIGIRGYASLPDSKVSGLNITVGKLVNGSAGLLCANKDLARRWHGFHPNIYVCYSAGDSRLWYPPTTPSQRTGPLIVGWAGNSLRRVKQVRELLLPVIKAASEKVVLLLADKEINFIPQSKMREEFYYKIDVLACTSITEGTPNPALEAMLCGVPVISTRVGHLVEIIKDGMNGWLVDRDISTFARRLMSIAKNRSMLRQVSEAARSTAQGWTWEHKIADWKKAVEDALR